MHNILTDFKNAILALSILSLSIQDVSEKISVELKSTISLLNFNTKNEMPVFVINATSREINGYPKFNKTKLHNESMGTKKFLMSTMLSGKKHQNTNECCWLAFISMKNAVITSV